MATAVGKLPVFDSNSGSLNVFVERFELHATANVVAEAKKLHLFLSAIGEEAYVMLRSLLLPKAPSTATCNEVVVRCRSTIQQGVQCFLEQALRDRLIAGLNSEAVRCRLLTMTDTECTWDRVCNIASAMEIAARDALGVVAENSTTQSYSSSDVHWQSKSPKLRPRSEAGASSDCGPDKPTIRTSMQRAKSICHRCEGGGGGTHL
ncbi:hypothetical protein HPB49_009305 [Dermacentor silvarum]|uniref:Uncharacterized protein n=1 Tax=Dermacentor silvarum TaxID=543639 RepID=A0ACB8CQP5_DERSI|nr:hypothetical protein HPB49_009305 [Dermacentor silvarum]